MKRGCVILCLLLVSGLVSCVGHNRYSLIVPGGSPQLALMYVDEDPDYLVDIVQGADALVAAFGSKSHDFIVAPTNLGAKLYQTKPDYILIAAIVFGNYYLVTQTDSVFDLDTLNGREITVFGMNQTSEIILTYILSSHDIVSDYRIVDSVQTAMADFVFDPSRVVLVAEPSLSILRAQFPDISVIDLQAAYQELTGESSYPQAGAFARATLTHDEISDFLDLLEASVNQVLNSPETAADTAASLNYPYSRDVLLSAIPNSHLGFVPALDVREDLEAYFSLILERNPALIGGGLPDHDFYYLP